MNIVFMGTPAFAVPSLERLFNSNHKITSVVTVPDKPKGRGLKTIGSDVKNFAIKQNIKVLQPDSLKGENFINEIRDQNPELIVVVAFRILPAVLFNLPVYGSINLHASLLPKYRGAAPINWAIINGETETGATTFFLKEKVDTGNIILQEKCSINKDDNAGALHDRLSILGAELLMKTVNLLDEKKENIPITNQDNSHATPAPKLTPELCRIDWNRSTEEIYNLIRGLSPYPAAYTFMNGKRLKIYNTTFTDIELDNKPGTVLLSNGINIKTKDNYLKIEELQPEGKKRMHASEFLSGYKPENGTILE